MTTWRATQKANRRAELMASAARLCLAEVVSDFVCGLTAPGRVVSSGGFEEGRDLSPNCPQKGSKRTETD